VVEEVAKACTVVIWITTEANMDAVWMVMAFGTARPPSYLIRSYLYGVEIFDLCLFSGKSIIGIRNIAPLNRNDKDFYANS